MTLASNRFRAVAVLLMLLFPAVSVQGAELRTAFLKEFAFLEEQKRELADRLRNFKAKSDNEYRTGTAKLRSMEDQLANIELQAEELRTILKESERETEANRTNRDILEATYQQASASLRDYGVVLNSRPELSDSSSEQRLASLFEIARETRQSLGRIRTTTGEFFLEDGRKVSGSVVRVGNIAAFGVSQEGAGALAPAGPGRFRLWPAPAAESAQALSSDGKAPDTLELFLFENQNADVAPNADKTIAETVASGGLIAWVIVGLGTMALALIVARTIFLRFASSETGRILEQVGGTVTEGRLQQALALCDQAKGSIARVLAATIRNLDREREHLEDIVSESILNESSSLNRFGGFIMVIAAVSPLLGLLGTVTGMISTFDVITEFGTGDPKLLSGGISTALVTTQLGLVVAIPTLIIGNLLTGWSNRIKQDMEKAALHVINLHEKAA